MPEQSKPIIVTEAEFHAIKDHLPPEILERCHVDAATIDTRKEKQRLDEILKYERELPDEYSDEVPF